MILKLLILILFLQSCSLDQYPKRWNIEKEKLHLTNEGELALLANTADTPFYYESKRYASLESFWQMLKFPDPELKNDPRHNLSFPAARAEVAALPGKEARQIGKKADELMRKHQITWISYAGKKMEYCSKKRNDHFYLIRNIYTKKFRYNYDVRRWLMSTGQLILLPDKNEILCDAPAGQYQDMWMQIRKDHSWYNTGPMGPGSVPTLAPGVQSGF